MDSVKVKKRIANLQKVKRIVEIAKIDTIQKISKTVSVKDHHHEIARLNQEIIAFALSKSVINKKIYEGFKKNKQHKRVIWIYITIPSKLIKMSYVKYERIIRREMNAKKDLIIPVGEPAIKFVKSRKYKILESYDELAPTSNDISALILHLINTGIYDAVKVVAKSSNFKNGIYDVYPFRDLSYDKKRMKQVKFYYSLFDAINNISESYMRNIINGIYQEVYWNFYREKLALHEVALKNIDLKINDSNLQLAKQKRKNETEEMIQLIQAAKRK